MKKLNKSIKIILLISFLFLQSCATIDKKYHHSVNGDNYFEQGLYDLAIAEYTKAIEIDPKYGSCYCDRGRAYFYKGEYDRASSDINKGIELFKGLTGSAECYLGRGEVYVLKGQYVQGISDFGIYRATSICNSL